MEHDKELSMRNRRHLTFSLLVVIFMLITAQAIRQYELSKQTNYAKTINKAGKQRMISQRIAKEVLLDENSVIIISSFEQLKKSHDELKALSLESYSNKIISKYYALDKTIKDIDKYITCHSGNECNTNENEKLLIKSLDHFVLDMDFIVNNISTEVEGLLKNFKLLELMIFCFILAVITLKITRFIFPMQAKLLNIINNYHLAKESNKKVEEAASIGSWEINLKTDEITWSDELYKIYGFNKNDNLDKRKAIGIYPKEEQEKILSYINNTITNSESFDDEFSFTNLNGDKKWVRFIGEPILNNKNKVEKIVGILQDISNIKQQEINIIETSEILKIALDGGQIAVWKWDVEYRNAECDDNWHKLYGIPQGTAEENLTAWKNSLHPVDLDRVHNEFYQYVEKNEGTFETTHRNKDKEGNWKYILTQGILTNNKQTGRMTLFIGTSQDITETIKSQNEQKFIFESLDLGIVKWDISSDHIEWDDYIYSLYGYSKTDYSSPLETWLESLGDEREETIAYLRGEVKKALKRNKDLDTTFPIITKLGEKKYIGIKATFEKNDQGKAINLYGINWDRTNEVTSQLHLEQQRKNAEQNAKLANIGEMAAGIGHEINNPLSVIKGYVEIMKKESQSDYLNKILHASSRIEKIVSGLRQFVRSTDNNAEKINLNSLLQITYDTLFELYAKESIKLEIDLRTKGFIRGNFGRIQQVIVNLIANAKDSVKGSSEGLITISLEAIDDFLSIKVSDNGPGIPKHIQSRVFDPFFTTKGVNKGTGIGLSLAASITKEHNGSLSFESDSTGTNFILRFPKASSLKQQVIEEDLELDLTEKQPEVAQAETEKLKVLCVDDEEDILDILSFYLSEIGVSANTFSNPQKAYEELIGSNDYDLVITDLQMPQLSGLELVEMIRNNKEIKQPKIIISTGGVNLNIEDKKNKISGMIDSYLYKPYDLDKLQGSIKNCNI